MNLLLVRRGRQAGTEDIGFFGGRKRGNVLDGFQCVRYLRYHFIILLIYLSIYLLSRYVVIPLGRLPSHSVIVIVVVVLCTEGGREGEREGKRVL